jgi:hypothetical protein
MRRGIIAATVVSLLPGTCLLSDQAPARGVAVPPNTPVHIIKTLEDSFIKVANMPQVHEEMKRQGFIPVGMGHEQSKDYVLKMTAIYKELAAGLKKRKSPAATTRGFLASLSSRYSTLGRPDRLSGCGEGPA